MADTQVPETADVVAYCLATLDEDNEAARVLLRTAGGLDLMAYAVDVALSIACEALPGGEAELREKLTSWQAQRFEGL